MRGAGPSFLLANTYRYHGHHVGDVDRSYYRTKEEEQLWRDERDPLALLGSWLEEQGYATGEELRRIEEEAGSEIERGLAFALDGAVPRRGPGDGGRLCLARRRPAVLELTFAQAINAALEEELARDPAVFILGEDVAEAGTPFKVLVGPRRGVRAGAGARLADLGGGDHGPRRRRRDDRACGPWSTSCSATS